MLAPAAPAANAVPDPALHSRPGHRGDQYGDRQRDGNTGDIHDVAKCVVRRGLLERLWLLSERDEHQTSSLFDAEAVRRGVTPSMPAVMAPPRQGY